MNGNRVASVMRASRIGFGKKAAPVVSNGPAQPVCPTHQQRKRPLHTMHVFAFQPSRSEAPDRFAAPPDPPSGRMHVSLDTGDIPTCCDFCRRDRA